MFWRKSLYYCGDCYAHGEKDFAKTASNLLAGRMQMTRNRAFGHPQAPANAQKGHSRRSKRGRGMSRAQLPYQGTNAGPLSIPSDSILQHYFTIQMQTPIAP
jgi:hypothetical protein